MKNRSQGCRSSSESFSGVGPQHPLGNPLIRYRGGMTRTGITMPARSVSGIREKKVEPSRRGTLISRTTVAAARPLPSVHLEGACAAAHCPLRICD
jgi:hypothetical protein